MQKQSPWRGNGNDVPRWEKEIYTIRSNQKSFLKAESTKLYWEVIEIGEYTQCSRIDWLSQVKVWGLPQKEEAHNISWRKDDLPCWETWSLKKLELYEKCTPEFKLQLCPSYPAWPDVMLRYQILTGINPQTCARRGFRANAYKSQMLFQVICMGLTNWVSQ